MWRIFKKKRSLRVLSILISAIAVLCAGFFITMCGSGPQTSSTLINRGAYAVDLSPVLQDQGNANTCIDYARRHYINILPTVDISGSEFTMEAWVKKALLTDPDSGSALDLTTNILGIEESSGSFVGINISANSPSVTSFPVGGVTSVVPLTNNQWTHIAGVLVNEDHSTGPNAHAACTAAPATTGDYTSIAIDTANNKVYIGYRANTILKYTRSDDDGATWPAGNIETIDTATPILYPSIAVDSTYLHVSYYDSTNADLKYARCAIATGCDAEAEWTKTIVDSTGSVGLYSSIAVDSADNVVHISYNDDTNADLKYAICDVDTAGCDAIGEWTKTTVDSTGTVGYYTSIAVDSADNVVHISYWDGTNGDLKYAICDVDTAGCDAIAEWTKTAVDSTGTVGYYTSIAVDSTDNVVHISYFDSTNGDLKYAVCDVDTAGCDAVGEWTKTAVDSTGTVGYYTSIAVDSADNVVHISYFDNTNYDLKYAICDVDTAGCDAVGEWTKTAVDSTGIVGQYSSIAVDSADNVVHISYFDNTNTNLKYAVCDVDTAGCDAVGEWTKTAVDSGENARLERPHLDLYTNGSFTDCNTTNWGFPTGNFITTMIGNYDANTSGVIVDEARLWRIARTPSQISGCYNKELGISGDCAISPLNLIGYWRLNAGTGSSVADSSGNGRSGSKLSQVWLGAMVYSTSPYCSYAVSPSSSLDEGWVSGYPF